MKLNDNELEKLLDEEEFELKLTLKGKALLYAMECGLCPKKDDEHYDCTAFNKFWNAFQPELAEEIERKSIEKETSQRRNERTEDSGFKISPMVIACLLGCLVGSLLFFLIRIAGIL